MKLLTNIKEKVIKHFTKYYEMWFLGHDDIDQTKVEDLVWMPKSHKPGQHDYFNNVDTIEFGINKIPVQEEIIFEVCTMAEANKIIETIAK